jgi:hypothetical protein
MPDGVPRLASIAVDLRVLGAAAVLALVTGLIFGLYPALQLSRADLTQVLREGGRAASAGGARQLIRSALVVAEVALAVVLLVGAALFFGSFRQLMAIDPGFDPANLLTAGIVPRLELAAAPSGPPPDAGPQLQQLIDRLQQIPGVRHAGAISGGMPMGGSMSITTIQIAGRTLSRADGSISIRRVTSDYHKAMGIALKDGRYFEPTDRQGGTPVVIVNEAAATKYFPGESAV